MADQANQPEKLVSSANTASSSGKVSPPQEVRQGEDPLSASQTTESPDVNDVNRSGKSPKPRRRSGAISHRSEEATTVGGGDGGLTSSASGESAHDGGRGSQGRASIDGTSSGAARVGPPPQTIMNG